MRKRGLFILLQAAEKIPPRIDFYRVNLDGKKLQRLTFGDYTHIIINLISRWVLFYNHLQQCCLHLPKMTLLDQ